MSINPEIASMEKSQIRSGDNCRTSEIAAQLWNVSEMRSLCKPALLMPSEFGELLLADSSTPALPLEKVMTEVTTETVQPSTNTKGGKIGNENDWNRDYGTDQTKLGMPNNIDKGKVNMEVNSAGTVRTYQWGHDKPNVDGTVRDLRVDVDKYNNTHVGLRAEAQKLELPADAPKLQRPADAPKLELPADDPKKSVHGQIIKQSH